MEAKAEEIIAKKTETKVKKNRLGTFFVWLLFLSFGMLLTVGDCRTFVLIAFLIILVIIATPTNSKKEEAITKKTETKTNKTTTEKATKKVENKGSGMWFIWLMLSCFVILILAGDWYTICFSMVLFICSIPISMKKNITEEEEKKQKEKERKVANFITLM